METRRRILCYGDSNTAGFHDQGKRFEPYGKMLATAMMEAKLPCEVVFCGLSGITIEEMLQKKNAERITDVVNNVGSGLQWILDRDSEYDLVILMAGSNDIAKLAQPEQVMHRVAELHDICHRLAIPTVAIVPPTVPREPYATARWRLSQQMHSWANSTAGAASCFDIFMLLPRSIDHWEEDELHLSPSGSKELGSRLAKEVKELWGAVQIHAKAYAAARHAGPSSRQVTSPSVPTPLQLASPKVPGCSQQLSSPSARVLSRAPVLVRPMR